MALALRSGVVRFSNGSRIRNNVPKLELFEDKISDIPAALTE